MRVYASEGRGKRRPSTLYHIIKKDQDIFKAIIRLNKLTVPKTTLKPSRRGGRGCYQIVAETHNSNHNEVETVYKRYKQKADALMGRLTKSDHRTIQLMKERGMIPHTQKPLPPPLLMTSWEDVFQWLNSMAETLAFVGGGRRCHFLNPPD